MEWKDKDGNVIKDIAYICSDEFEGEIETIIEKLIRFRDDNKDCQVFIEKNEDYDDNGELSSISYVAYGKGIAMAKINYNTLKKYKDFPIADSDCGGEFFNGSLDDIIAKLTKLRDENKEWQIGISHETESYGCYITLRGCRDETPEEKETRIKQAIESEKYKKQLVYERKKER